MKDGNPRRGRQGIRGLDFLLGDYDIIYVKHRIRRVSNLSWDISQSASLGLVLIDTQTYISLALDFSLYKYIPELEAEC